MPPTKKHQHSSSHKVGALQQITVDEGAVACCHRTDNEEVEADAGDHRLDPNLGRVEPVLEFAAVEQHL
jgi:hypothetical protein